MSKNGCWMNSNNAEPIRYLTVSEVYNINDTITDGHTFVRDVHLLQSAIKRPALVLFGEEQFPTLVDKAASLLHSLAYHHLFADANKRTAVQAVEMFLRMNGFTLSWDDAARYTLLLEIAQGMYDIEQVAAHLEPYIKPLEK